jgi:hypothetical protein
LASAYGLRLQKLKAVAVNNKVISVYCFMRKLLCDLLIKHK